jgi:hypothetical protein
MLIGISMYSVLPTEAISVTVKQISVGVELGEVLGDELGTALGVELGNTLGTGLGNTLGTELGT